MWLDRENEPVAVFEVGRREAGRKGEREVGLLHVGGCCSGGTRLSLLEVPMAVVLVG